MIEITIARPISAEATFRGCLGQSQVPPGGMLIAAQEGRHSWSPWGNEWVGAGSLLSGVIAIKLQHEET